TLRGSLLVLAALMVIIVGWLVWPTLNAKPWVEQQSVVADGEGTLPLPPIKVGLGVFLAVATSLFALLISAYHMRMMEADWTTLPLPRVLWLNTAVLVIGGAAMQWTRTAAQRGQTERVRTGLFVPGVFSVLFLPGHFSAGDTLGC